MEDAYTFKWDRIVSKQIFLPNIWVRSGEATGESMGDGIIIKQKQNL